MILALPAPHSTEMTGRAVGDVPLTLALIAIWDWMNVAPVSASPAKRLPENNPEKEVNMQSVMVGPADIIKKLTDVVNALKEYPDSMSDRDRHAWIMFACQMFDLGLIEYKVLYRFAQLVYPAELEYCELERLKKNGRS